MEGHAERGKTTHLRAPPRSRRIARTGRTCTPRHHSVAAGLVGPLGSEWSMLSIEFWAPWAHLPCGVSRALRTGTTHSATRQGLDRSANGHIALYDSDRAHRTQRMATAPAHRA
eukprot:scaffold22778_cov36-Tisochrysis_lutea.AAC.4